MPVRALLAVVLGAAVLATIAAPALATPSAPQSPDGPPGPTIVQVHGLDAGRPHWSLDRS
jgi:hypothetical protein